MTERRGQEIRNRLLSKGTSDALVFALKSDRLQNERRVRLRGMEDTWMYELLYHNDGRKVRKTGWELKTERIMFVSDTKYWSEIVEVHRIKKEAVI